LNVTVMWLGGWSRLRVGRRSLPPADQGLEGVKVRQPDIVDFSRSYSTPWWSSRGFCVACPRDSFLVIGDETIETPMCWRSRYFEAIAYRSLFKEYFHAGARWTSAARPMLTGPWTSIKVLMLDEKRVIVDRSQVSLIQSFKAWGFEPIAFRFGAMVRSAARSIAQRSTSGAAARFSDRERFERREAIGLASV
jgi:hypothetical protein